MWDPVVSVELVLQMWQWWEGRSVGALGSGSVVFLISPRGMSSMSS
jgi:hypothetical protein